MRTTRHSLELPYRWRPLAASPVHDGALRAGDLVPLAHAVYCVVEHRQLPADSWSADDRAAVAAGRPAPFVLQLRPVGADSEFADLFVGSGGAHEFSFDRYPSAHYPVCADCDEPMPCRDQVAAAVAAAAAERMSRFEHPGVCPACRRPIRAWQAARTWTENLELPGGPPVSFHLRRACRAQALEYARRLAG